jgi:hypothetical protein
MARTVFSKPVLGKTISARSAATLSLFDRHDFTGWQFIVSGAIKASNG